MYEQAEAIRDYGHLTRRVTASVAAAIAVSSLLILSSVVYGQEDSTGAFEEKGTFEVPGDGVAEIVAATPDGETLVYTDSDGGAVGFVDLTDPAEPKLLGEPVKVDGEPTSVGVSPDGSLALVAVQTSTLEEGEPPELTPGKLVAVDIATRKVAGAVEIGVGPDALAVTEVGGKPVAVVAIENEPVVVDQEGNLTDKEGPGEDGDQSNPGLVQVITVNPADIADSEVADVELELSESGLLFPADPQPEFVDIGPDGRAAVSLQENNGVAVFNALEAMSGAPEITVFDLGVVGDRPADLTADGKVSLSETYPADALDAEAQAGTRVADAIAWNSEGTVVYTANEGELDLTGGRGFSAFSAAGELLFDDNGQLTAASADRGLYPEDVAEEKGLEVEGVETGVYGDSEYLFVGSEAGSFVGVYRLTDPTAPEFDGILPTGDAPEGLLAIGARGLFITANEDSGTVSIFGLSDGILTEDLTETGGPPLGMLAIAVGGICLISIAGVLGAWVLRQAR